METGTNVPLEGRCIGNFVSAARVPGGVPKSSHKQLKGVFEWQALLLHTLKARVRFKAHELSTTRFSYFFRQMLKL
jgi:hypothetical protein